MTKVSGVARVAARTSHLINTKGRRLVSEESWHEARLIPTSGISGADEQERRATSALLAVLSAVREYGKAITGPLGAPSGTVSTYIEVPFLLDGRRLYPDGLIRVSRGSKSWTCLVEVKTGTSELQTEQVEAYLEIAREQGFDALLTISNEIPPNADQHPTKVDKRKLRKVALHHLSWSQVLAAAVIQKEHRGVADLDQAWILGELIRYLEHPRSGALEFEDMGAAWVPVRDAVANGTLRANDKMAPDLASRFDAMLRFASLRLGRRLGTEVTPFLPKKDAQDPAARQAALVQNLAASGRLSGAIRVPNAVAPLHVTLDLRAGTVTCHVDIDAPRDGRPTTRVNWLVRQLKAAPESMRLEAFAAYARGGGTAELLRDVRENPAVLLDDSGKEIRTFRLALVSPLGPKRGRGRGGAVDSVLDSIDTFYGTVLSDLRAWAAAPPRLRPEPTHVEQPAVEPDLVSTSLSSQDEPSESAVDDAAATSDAAGLPAVEEPDEEAPAAWASAYADFVRREADDTSAGPKLPSPNPLD
jgi:hypothetical protein